MINFLEKIQLEDKRIDDIRRTTVAATTVLLVTFLVVVAALGGWWWWVASRAKAQTVEEEQLRLRLVRLAEPEVLVRKLAMRSQVVVNWLDSRGEAAKKINRLGTGSEGVNVEKWNYGEDRQSVEVAADSAAKITQYASRLAGFYQEVTIDKAVMRPGSGWKAVIRLKGEKGGI
ncbi:hypothetical protein A3H89_05045 [Candidatus Amesbacteria bacterium RIFCSPLOWO2_02_FULL_48_11]|uniref:Uncharacterized protein n=3 Tax=Candidatus Amesiibacteriota TaxID=1752730 RepID=A0A1F4Z6L1_9BACT|nr:MAG: hypothetical protein UX78_C0012G0033 [Candidatus Amesbacteria bacterium GW2011_GWA2_47_11]KKU94193.1 MAG: hypothetical protein UY22_C0015G0017 [Candidatus Amesbacteria bacterium GW2011_GWC1_48_10]OGC89094.1 MAG: hypothetical protein A2V48_01840 [Candidatus Amesbacteria bacterium RBG_19FT_COMBO_48_16]OGC95360.1 MAG: hypothetical protein A3C34_04805 [Candidatus Amesbacteria bacterium RIFCSPHIGHO2_02_FULL_48_21]OGC98656.1 MAG: hypothetical protein A2702_01300 [Candidatus Amesbacteria bacte